MNEFEVGLKIKVTGNENEKNIFAHICVKSGLIYVKLRPN